MAPDEPAPLVSPEPSKEKPGAVVPLVAAAFLLSFGVFSSPIWQINFIAFLFSAAGLPTARGWIQRVLAVGLSGITGASSLISYWSVS